MTPHSVRFSMNLKIFSLNFPHLISLLIDSTLHSRKDISPNYIKFSKNRTKNGKFAWSQKSYKREFHYSKKNGLEQFKKLRQN